MPRNKLITKEKVIEAAIAVLQSDGEKGLNARSIAKQLNTSTQPVYSVFKNMAELKEELLIEAEKRYRDYAHISNAQSDNVSAYHHYGISFIKFAAEEKTLFAYLYMRNRESPTKWISDVNIEEILQSIQDTYGVDRVTAENFHHDMAIYSYGLAVLINTGYSDMTIDEAAKRLQVEFVALSQVYFKDLDFKRKDAIERFIQQNKANN